MFTLDQIHDAFAKVKSGADFPLFVQELKSLGITHYDNFVSDGSTVYYGLNNHTVHGNPKYAPLSINPLGSEEKLMKAISIHQKGETDYPTFCEHAADSGVEKWTTHMIDSTVTYFDQNGNKLVVEPIPEP